MTCVPTGARPGRTTPTFTADTVPAGLKRAHHTTVWAELVVVAGAVEFVDEESGSRTVVNEGERCTIVPDQRHHVEPGPAASFYVQFYEL